MLFTILDIETTGFKYAQRPGMPNDDILEVGYIQVDERLNMLRHGVFYFYQPDFVLNAEAEAVHGLTRDFLEEHQEEFDASLCKLYTLMQQGVIIGKNNIGFDTPFIIDFLSRRGKGLPEINVVNQVDLQDIFTPIFRRWYKSKTGENTRKLGKLGELMEVIGKSMNEVESEYCRLFPDVKDRCGAHSALFDVYMTYLLLEYAVKDGLDLTYYAVKPTAEEMRKYLDIQLDRMLEDIVSAREGIPRCMDADLGNKLGSLFVPLCDLLEIKDYAPLLASDYRDVLTMKDMVASSTFGYAVTSGFEKGICYGVWIPGRVRASFIPSYFTVGMLLLYYETGDKLIVKFLKCLMLFLGYLSVQDVCIEEGSGLPFMLQKSKGNYADFCEYIDYRHDVFGLPIPECVESQELVTLARKRDMTAFWKLLIPSVSFLACEFLSGRILDNKIMLEFVLNLTSLKRGN